MKILRKPQSSCLLVFNGAFKSLLKLTAALTFFCGTPVAARDDEAPPIAHGAGVPISGNTSGPSPFGRLRILSEGEAPEEYVVESGDTLFDICDQLLDEPGYWPKLWSFNTEIKNPHYIWPGMKLRFYPGDANAPPLLTVVSEPDFAPTLGRDTVDIDDLLKDRGMLGRIDQKPVPVVGTDQIAPADEMFQVIGGVRDDQKFEVTIPGFIYPEPVQPIGEIVAGTMGEIIGSEGRLMLVKASEGLVPSLTYTVLRAQDQVKDPTTSRNVGYKYEYVGNVLIQKKIDDGTLAIAHVIKNRADIRGGDIIVPYVSTIRSVRYQIDGERQQIPETHIIAFEIEGNSIGAQGSMVYLDRGSRDGVEEGKYMEIYQGLNYLVQLRMISDVPKDRMTVGVLQIVDVTPAGSIGYVLESTQELNIGDPVGLGAKKI